MTTMFKKKPQHNSLMLIFFCAKYILTHEFLKSLPLVMSQMASQDPSQVSDNTPSSIFIPPSELQNMQSVKQPFYELKKIAQINLKWGTEG